MFKELFTEFDASKDIQSVAKELRKCKDNKDAKVNNNGKIDITVNKSKSDKIFSKNTMKCLDKHGLIMTHAYNGLSGDSFEVEFGKRGKTDDGLDKMKEK